MREDHGGERWSWKTFFAGVAVVAAVVAVAAFTVASGGTAAVAIAGVIGVKTATVTAVATTVAAYSCAYGAVSNSRGSNYRYSTRNDRYDNPRSRGTPRNNQVQNKQFNDVVNKLRLTKDQARRLHETITGQGYDYQEILQTAKDMFRR